MAANVFGFVQTTLLPTCVQVQPVPVEPVKVVPAGIGVVTVNCDVVGPVPVFVKLTLTVTGVPTVVDVGPVTLTVTFGEATAGQAAAEP